MQITLLNRGQLVRLEQVLDNVHHWINTRFLGFRGQQGIVVGRMYGSPEIKPGDVFKAHIQVAGKRLSFHVTVLEKSDSDQQILTLEHPFNLSLGEMRRGQRIPVKPASLTVNLSSSSGDMQVEVSDVSRNGACLVAPKRLGNIDDKFQIGMRIPYSGVEIDLPCIVRYVRSEVAMRGPRGHGVSHHHGVRFDRLSGLAQGFLDDFIAARVPLPGPHSFQ